MKPSPRARGSPQDNSWEGYHPTQTPKCAPPMWNPPHGGEDAQQRAWHTHAIRTTRSVHVRPQWYQNNLIGIIHISHPHKDKRSRKSTSRPCSGVHLIILYILTITRPQMDLGQQLMQSTNPADNQESTFTTRWATSPPHWDNSQLNRGWKE